MSEVIADFLTCFNRQGKTSSYTQTDTRCTQNPPLCGNLMNLSGAVQHRSTRKCSLWHFEFEEYTSKMYKQHIQAPTSPLECPVASDPCAWPIVIPFSQWKTYVKPPLLQMRVCMQMQLVRDRVGRYCNDKSNLLFTCHDQTGRWILRWMESGYVDEMCGGRAERAVHSALNQTKIMRENIHRRRSNYHR